MTNRTNSNYEQLLSEYFSSQAFAYILAAVFFIVRYKEVAGLFIIGWVLCLVSIMLLIAPLSKVIKDIAWKLDTWFRSALFLATFGILIIDAMLGSLRTDVGEIVFWTLLGWIFLFITVNSIIIGKRVGLYNFVTFGLASFGLLMIFTGHFQTCYYIIALVGLLLSIPALSEILDKWASKKTK